MSNIINDGMNITINFKWLMQLIVIVSIAVYGFWQIENRISQLESNVNSAMDILVELEEDRKVQAEKSLKELKEEINWYQKELNLNPFSWGKEKEDK